ncbi:MAG: hypothetical protein H6581_29315 [Bacteroidia bacterium]|nr:hypothetical protein [Bacteroidia bacterium]
MELPEDDIALLQERWAKLDQQLRKQFGKKVSMEGILFLIGVRELGASPHREFTKEEKQDLIHIAMCAILAPSGYFELDHLDQDGWPHWKELKPIPFIDIFGQELFLKSHVVDYFMEIYEL